jgi:3-oxoadipate enol-lactonase
MRNQGKNLTATVNNIKVNYNDEGPEDAPVIIFIHGFPFNKSMWKGQAEVLNDSYRVIAYDVRGHGDTDVGEVEFSIDLFVSDLLGLMDFLNVQKATLCGLSMGGYIALRAIEKDPEYFDALILSDTQCVADTPEAKEKRMKTIESIKETGVIKFAEDSVKNLFAAASLTTKQDSIASIKAMIVNTSKQSLSNTLHALANRKETCSGLVNISVPTLIMVGKEDPITPVAAAEFLHQHIQDSSLHIVQQAAHLPNIENPEDFDFQLKLFLHRFAKSPVPANPILVD